MSESRRADIEMEMLRNREAEEELIERENMGDDDADLMRQLVATPLISPEQVQHMVDRAQTTAASYTVSLSEQSLSRTTRSLQRIRPDRLRQSARLVTGEHWRLSYEWEDFVAPFDGEFRWIEGDDFVSTTRSHPELADSFALTRRRVTFTAPTSSAVTWDEATPAQGLSSITATAGSTALLFEDEAKQEEPPNIRANMGYIQMLMANYGFKLSLEQMQELARLSDKSAINKKMAEYYEQHKAGKPIGPNIDEIIQQASGDLQSFFKTKFEEKRNNIKKEITSYQKDANKYFAEAHNKLLRMNEKVIEFDQLKEDGTDVRQLFDSLSNNPFWRIEKFRDGILYFESNDVIVRYVNKAQNVDMTVNFGPMWAMWLTRNGIVKMDSTRMKYDVGGFPHPHVGIDGYVCWGNAASSYTNHIKSLNIAEILNILQSLLQTYNPGSPFARLDKFYAKSNPSISKGEFEHRPVRWAWVYCEDDDWEFSPDFDYESEEHFDEDSNKVLKIRVYHRFNKEFGIQVDEHEYIRSTNYRYFVLDKANEVDQDDVKTEEEW